MKNNKFSTGSALFFTTCTNTTLNFLLRRCLEDVNTARDKFNFFPESELGCGRKDSVRKFTYICHFKRLEIYAKMLKIVIKKHALILIARDVFVALAFVVTKAPYIHESDSSFLVLLQTRMTKFGKLSG